jgi:hypothetical protein
MGDRWPADATVQAGDSVVYLWKIKEPGGPEGPPYTHTK